METDTFTDIAIEALADGDEVTVQAVFDGMSPEARYFRFLQAMPHLRPSLRRILATVDGNRNQAFVARGDGRPLGIVRLHLDSAGDLELSVAVVDAARGRGIGRALVTRALAVAAAQHPGRTLAVLVHPENGPSVALFRSLGCRFELDEGLLVGRIPVGVLELVA